MKIRVLGAGLYGLHIGTALQDAGHTVEIHEISDTIMGGASGNIPARLHQGFHYPRSRATRRACQEHREKFMDRYARFTRGIQTNIYAVAADESMVDYEQYIDSIYGEVDYIEIYDPAEYGMTNVEGAVLTGERHIQTDMLRAHFWKNHADIIRLNCSDDDAADFDITIDCTFSANSSAGVDRYEPCLVVLLKAPTDKAVTIMDGKFGSLYPWNAKAGLCSLSSAKWTPFSKDCKTYGDAKAIIDALDLDQLSRRGDLMIEAMAHHYPAVMDYLVYEYRTSIRAMPKSGADTRLVDIRNDGNGLITVRAGKIDAIIHAEEIIKEMI